MYALFHYVFFLSACIHSECGLQKASRPLPVGYRLQKRVLTHTQTVIPYTQMHVYLCITYQTNNNNNIKQIQINTYLCFENLAYVGLVFLWCVKV